MRLILVPQFPQKLRYQEWWIFEFEKNLKKYFSEIVVLGKESDLIKQNEKYYLSGELFSPVQLSMKFEFEQIEEYYKMKIYDDDILLLLDVSFPGFFSNVLYHKRPNKIFGFCHATSINNLDYFSEVNYKYKNSKRDNEISLFNLFDKIFVGSGYHQRKLISNNFPKNIHCLDALPNPPFNFYNKNKSFKSRKNSIVSVSRPTPQKVNVGIEKFVEDYFDIRIKRPENINNWKDYYDFLQNSKVLLLTGCEDTYGYSIIDAYLNGCNVVVPYGYSYPYIINLRDNLFYSKNDLSSLVESLEKSLKEHKFKELNNEEYIKYFYDNLASKMLEG